MIKYLSKIAGLNQSKILMLMAILAGLYYFMGGFGEEYNALEQQIQTKTTELEAENVKLKETERLLKKAAALKESVSQLEEKYKTISKQLPLKLTSTDIMRTVDALAKTSNVYVKEKEPLPSEKKGILEKFPIKVTLKGNFSDLMMFLYYLTSMEKVTRIEKLTILKPDMESAQFRNSQVGMALEVSGFSYIGGEVKSEK